MDTAKRRLANLERGREDPDDAPSTQRPARRRLFVVGDDAIVDPLQSAMQHVPGLLVVGDPDETSCLLQSNGAGVVVVDIFDRGEAGAEPNAGSSGRPVVGLGFGSEALEVLGDLLKAVVDTTRSAPPRHAKREQKSLN
jgi:hypothetical protein